MDPSWDHRKDVHARALLLLAAPPGPVRSVRLSVERVYVVGFSPWGSEGGSGPIQVEGKTEIEDDPDSHPPKGGETVMEVGMTMVPIHLGQMMDDNRDNWLVKGVVCNSFSGLEGDLRYP